MPPTAVPGYEGRIYSATYSSVPVFEFVVEDHQVMRRKEDSWINATHILKVAEFDKPARTRILEREVQKNTHQKIQGGYGKYQGTWIPLEDGEDLAKKNGVFDKLRPIFEFRQNTAEKSPPPAPKHTTAASNKPKIPKAAPVRRVAKPKPLPPTYAYNQYEKISTQLHDENTPDNSTVVSESVLDEEEAQLNAYSGSRKRKRDGGMASMSKHELDHQIYAEALLDYFMLQNGETPYVPLNPPIPPENFEVDRPVDNQRHTGLHWAVAMGETEIVKDLIRRGASIQARNVRGETPLIRAILFANCYEKGTMPKILQMLQETIMILDDFGGTILHHIAYTAHSNSKTQRARYYIDVLLNKLRETHSQLDLMRFVDIQDNRGDTAFHIAARNSRRCIKSFQAVHASSSIPNNNGETVQDYLKQRAALPRRSNKSDHFLLSSSPVQPDHPFTNGREPDGKSSHNISDLQVEKYRTAPARNLMRSFSTISEKADELSRTLEDESNEKDLALAEARRLQQNVEMERRAIHQKSLALTAQVEEEDVTGLQQELANLQKQAEALAEQKQHSTLHILIRTEETKAASCNNYGNGVTGGNDTIEAKIQTAFNLYQEQLLRREFTQEIVRGNGKAGISEKGEQLMKLVTMSLGLRSEDIPGMLPELLETLEMSNRDGASPSDLVETPE